MESRFGAGFQQLRASLRNCGLSAESPIDDPTAGAAGRHSYPDGAGTDPQHGQWRCPKATKRRAEGHEMTFSALR
jgi:hypothetical protein